jgi:TolB protein
VKRWKSAALLTLLSLAAASAVNAQTPEPPILEEDVVGTLSNDTIVAIPAFATNADVSTQTSAGTTAALGTSLAGIVAADLKSNGFYKPTGPAGLPRPSIAEVRGPNFATWSGRGAEMVVHGSVRLEGDGTLMVSCFVYDVSLTQQLASGAWQVSQNDWRRAGHKCAESGPKDRRLKRLAVMDSDGANHSYLTTGQTIALTPRYSPDYKSILYLSYFNGQPRIYIIDPVTRAQRLLLQSRNPLFAPRWSPDGKWVLYSMATGGNTDIYKISANGSGTPVKLTDSPGIDIGGSFSPDGSKIVFESDRSGSQQVYVMNADGTGQNRISFFGGRAATPEWSPRGDQIAFTHIVGNFRIAVMTPTGSELRYLTDSWQDEAPTWAPNGRIVQFFRTQRGSGRASLWQVDLTGRNERKLNPPGDGSDPAWGPIQP